MKTGRLIFASSISSADILYATDFHSVDPYLYFSSGETKGIVVPVLEYGRAVKQVKKGVKVFEKDDFIDSAPGSPATLKSIVFNVVKRFPSDIWEVPNDFPFALARYLMNKGVSLECPESDFYPQRRVKNKTEILHITDALRLAEKAMKRALGIIKTSKVNSQKQLVWNGGILTSEILKTEINLEIVAGGGVMCSTIASSGKLCADPHNTGSGPVYADTPIVIDIFPKIEATGYWGDITRTFVKGKAGEKLKKAYNAVHRAVEYAKSVIKAGAIPAEIHKSVNEILESQGFKTGKEGNSHYGFFHSLGHGIGLEIHENPQVSPRNSHPLAKGNVITIEPGLYYPEWGGIRIEDMVVVGEKSCETLTEFPVVLEVS